MIRTQIQLTEKQVRRLRERCRRRGISLAEMIRQCVDRHLIEETEERSALYDRAAALVGKFPDRANASDLARNHDEYLSKALK